MASLAINPSSEPAIFDQLITEFFAKSLQIILEARTSRPTPSSTSSSRGHLRDRWFNLALRDGPSAIQNFDPWRESNLDPMVVDVILNRSSSLPDVRCSCSGGCQIGTFGCERKDEKIVERWVVQYEGRYSGNNRSTGLFTSPTYTETYKKSMVLLRSLYVLARILPGYKIFHAICSSIWRLPFSLFHRISSFPEPFTRAEDAEMDQFGFQPVDTHCGRLSLCVSYLRLLEDMSSELCMPISMQFIPEYVGSSMVHPLKRFQFLPLAEPHAPLTRRHGTNDACGEKPSVFCVLNCNPNNFIPPRSHTHRRNQTLERNCGLVNQAQPPCPSSKIKGLECYPEGAHDTTTTAPLSSSIESRPPIKKNSQSLGDFQIGMVLKKVLSFGKDSNGNFLGLCNSTRFQFAKRSGRLSLLDQVNDAEIACPFAVDDKDLTDSCNRPESSDGEGHKSGNSESDGSQPAEMSSDATVGALIWMLKTAEPLRHNLSARTSRASKAETSTKELNNNTCNPGFTAPELIKSTAVSDALEELRSYRETKESLLQQGRLQCAAKSAGGCPSEL